MFDMEGLGILSEKPLIPRPRTAMELLAPGSA
jgi:hypothetical protein